MLKKELNEKDEEIRRLQAQLSKLQVTNEDQLNRLRLLESQDQVILFYDTSFLTHRLAFMIFKQFKISKHVSSSFKNSKDSTSGG